MEPKGVQRFFFLEVLLAREARREESAAIGVRCRKALQLALDLGVLTAI